MKLVIRRTVRKAWLMAIEEDLKPISDEFGFLSQPRQSLALSFVCKLNQQSWGWLYTLPERSTLTAAGAM